METKAFSNMKLFACNSHPELAKEIADLMGVELGKATVSKFSDGEISVSIWESVRDKDVFIIQSTGNPVNDNLMELLIMVDAMKRASAGSINAVIPYYGYARQDRKAKARDPITAKLVADLPDFQRLDVFIHRQRVLLFGKPQIGIPVARDERYRIRPVEIVLSTEMVEVQDVGLEIVARQHQVPGDAPVFGHLDAAHGLNRKG